MNEFEMQAEDARLSALLRESRATPRLPPRFQEGVWRRLESQPTSDSAGSLTWLEALAGWALRPRLALAAVAVLMVAGGLLGVRAGDRIARQEAQAHYLAAVAPNPLP
jgi:hypothetical protein